MIPEYFFTNYCQLFWYICSQSISHNMGENLEGYPGYNPSKNLPGRVKYYTGPRKCFNVLPPTSTSDFSTLSHNQDTSDCYRFKDETTLSVVVCRPSRWQVHVFIKFLNLETARNHFHFEGDFLIFSLCPRCSCIWNNQHDRNNPRTGLPSITIYF